MLTKLDISKNPHLKVLSAYSNTNMQAVDLSNNLKLLSIDLHGNENMGTIDVTKQTNLIELSVDLTGLSYSVLAIYCPNDELPETNL